MPKFTLHLQADLQNLSNLQPTSGASHTWTIQAKCSSCKETMENWVTFTADEDVEIPGSRGTANLVVKCKFCGSTGNLSVLKDSMHAYTEGTKKGLVTVECRGLEVTSWRPTNGEMFRAENPETGSVFEDIEIEVSEGGKEGGWEGEWVGWDDKGNCEVGVLGMKGSVEFSKK
ncbi:hypothetical protein HDV05_006044 [Chytridiales sp. JEL 0842]|nr:hypothetical protein HDV05_006044 [Chytridiales sp. JEL 0842]